MSARDGIARIETSTFSAATAGCAEAPLGAERERPAFQTSPPTRTPAAANVANAGILPVLDVALDAASAGSVPSVFVTAVGSRKPTSGAFAILWLEADISLRLPSCEIVF